MIMIKVSIRQSSILLCLIICSISTIFGSFGIFAKQFTVGKIIDPDNTIKSKPAHIGILYHHIIFNVEISLYLDINNFLLQILFFYYFL